MSGKTGRGKSGDAAAHLALDSFLPYRLSVLANTVSQSIARLYSERFGLSTAEWRAMAVLGAYAPLSAGDVAQRTAMDKVRVSRAIARLVRRGLVDRRTDGGDRRRSVLRLSREGGRVYRDIMPSALAVEAELLAALPEAERRALDRLLTALQAQAQRLNQDDGEA